MSVKTELAAPAMPPEPVLRLTVEQYHEMIDNGILKPDDPIELLEGWLVRKMPKEPPHPLSMRLVQGVLTRLLPADWFVSIQDPITLSQSEPEPDVMVVRGSPRDYAKHHPGPQDVALVVEVAEATLQRDRVWKKRLYALDRVPVYWVLDLVNRKLEVHTEPSGKGAAARYRRTRELGPDDSVPVVIDGRELGRVEVRGLLP